jgi:glyoxylase-like metal-dependent hydrolase (beta-lactamase superfamily II)/8-oxo-dGTP pyrophosphatase MutT (NUDIX family)
MTANFPGLPAPPPTEPVPAAAVVLWRDGPDGREVVLVRRGRELAFAGGWHAFPGGRLDPADRDVRVPGLAGLEAALVACAVREVFEETGILLAAGAERVPGEVRASARRALLEETLAFPRFLAEHELAIDAGRLTPAGRWITPEHLPLRYDAQVFLAPVAAEARAEIWPGELADGGFVPARRALEAWRRGEVLLHPPNLNALRILARPGPIDLAALRDPPQRDGFIARRIEFQEGFFLAALRTPTLPPATHTNAWLVPDGEKGLAVVDPGADDRAEQRRLFELLDAHAAEGRPPGAVWLTHAHPDHVGAVSAVVERYHVPVRAHPLAAGRARVPIEPLAEGDRLGRFRVLATPGHAREHLVFLDEETGALLCGDMVSTLSTIVIDPPEGDMAEFVRQLARLAELEPRTLYPAHGPPVPDGAGRLRETLAHRQARERMVIAALARAGTLEEITARAYADTPAALHALASRSCLASLVKLRNEGRAVERGEVWSAAP